MPRVRSSKTRSTRMSEETYARNAAWRTCRKLRKVSTLFKSAKISKVKDIEDVIFRALSSRLQSHSSIVTHSKHVDSFLRFCARRNTKEPFTGPHSCFIIHDFLDSLKARGSSVPFDARYALKVFAESLEIDWPLESRVVLSALKNLRKKQESAPSFSADTVKRIESVITDESAPEAKKIFASSVLWSTHASLRFGDPKNVCDIATFDETISGTVYTSKTRKGIATPFVAMRQGFTVKDWHAPILKYQESFHKAQK